VPSSTPTSSKASSTSTLLRARLRQERSTLTLTLTLTAQTQVARTVMFASTFQKSDAAGANITVKTLDDVLNAEKSGTIDFVGAIDQGTSSTRFLVFTPQGEIGAWSQMEHKQYFPPGEDKVCVFC
jgi:hypothetical protein